MALPLRTRLAVALGQATAEISRRLRTGQGSSVGGKVMLALDPRALAVVSQGHRVAVVSGTNGKTTTTRLLAAALRTRGEVATNEAGANLLSGLVSTLSSAAPGSLSALEVDEGVLRRAVEVLSPDVAVLLNLSRDQLDRIGEVRLHAASWRHAMEASVRTVAAANADDPLVAWAAQSAHRVTWVATGQRWRSDAAACPACGGRIRWDAPVSSRRDGSRSEAAPSSLGGPAVDVGWACSRCSFARPKPQLTLDGDELVLPTGARVPVRLQLPGWCNRANAAMAAAGALAFGVDPRAATEAMAGVGAVAGRYQVIDFDGIRVRLLLAKNPAGWAETLDLIRPAPLPVVIGINARVADGRDPSWLWDVPFERLRGRRVIATGDRGRDLAVRLRYADVEHHFVLGYRAAVRAAAADDVDLAANYTSFQDARAALAPDG